jgi:hypothetical protein
MNTQYRYALRQTYLGQTIINAKGDTSIQFRIADIEKAKITSGGDFLVDTNTLVVKASENRVGINNTTPSKKLHVLTYSSEILAGLDHGTGGNDEHVGLGFGLAGSSQSNRIFKAGIFFQRKGGYTGRGDLLFCVENTQDGTTEVSPANVALTISRFGEVSATNSLTAASFSGSGAGLTAIPAAQITGTLAVANGGTGVNGSTGTGDVVLSNAPAFSGDVAFDTNTLFVDSTNNRVGIGTTSPGEKLHVNGNLRLGSSLNNSVDDDTEYSISTAGQLKIKSNDSGINGSYVNLQLQSGNVNPGKIVIGGGSIDQYKDIEFYTSGSSTERMRIHHNGNVGIGTTSPAYRLHIQDGNASMAQFGPSTSYTTSSLVVGAGTSQASATAGVICQMITTNGNMHLDAATSRDIYMNHYSGSYIRHGGLGLASDDRLKTNEELITNATETLLKLSPQKYTKARSLREAETREPFTETGLIAQDIWYDAPELRHVVLLGTDADPVEIKPEAPVEGDIQQDPDYSSWGPHEASVNYDGLIAYLIKSNQELHARIQALENA